jgi:RNA-directed DNA polymerase
MKIDANHLLTSDSVRKLQSSPQARAKMEPGYRFYSLWDKVCRRDFLAEA